jgi:hypothetical protein
MNQYLLLFVCLFETVLQIADFEKVKILHPLASSSVEPKSCGSSELPDPSFLGSVKR